MSHKSHRADTHSPSKGHVTICRTSHQDKVVLALVQSLNNFSCRLIDNLNTLQNRSECLNDACTIFIFSVKEAPAEFGNFHVRNPPEVF